MAFQMRRVQVWSCDIPDRPGAAVAKLEVLARAGADLQFIVTRPLRSRPEDGVLFVAPITGPEQVQAARSVGLAPALDVAMLVLEGDNRPGLGYELMSQLAVAGLNLRGLSVSAVDDRFAAYLAFDNADTVNQAIRVLAALEG